MALENNYKKKSVRAILVAHSAIRGSGIAR